MPSANRRELLFSGYRWDPKSSREPVGPGPNYFAGDNVWVDEASRLHLRVTRRGERWHCAEAICRETFGHGKYVFFLEPGMERQNENIVLGLFTWDTQPEHHNREIDIEFARWRDKANADAQYVVQPHDRPGNIHRFGSDLQGQRSAHSFDWRAQAVSFGSSRGDQLEPGSGADLIHSWVYTGEDIPPPGRENVRINLWLCSPDGPSDDEEAEVVVRRFLYLPPAK